MLIFFLITFIWAAGIAQGADESPLARRQLEAQGITVSDNVGRRIGLMD